MKWKEAKYKEDDNNKHPSESMSYKKEPWRKSKTNLPLSAPSADLSTMLNGSLACVLGSYLNITSKLINLGYESISDGHVLTSNIKC